jgi:hypothetical protein
LLVRREVPFLFIAAQQDRMLDDWNGMIEIEVYPA